MGDDFAWGHAFISLPSSRSFRHPGVSTGEWFPKSKIAFPLGTSCSGVHTRSSGSIVFSNSPTLKSLFSIVSVLRFKVWSIIFNSTPVIASSMRSCVRKANWQKSKRALAYSDVGGGESKNSEKCPCEEVRWVGPPTGPTGSHRANCFLTPLVSRRVV